MFKPGDSVNIKHTLLSGTVRRMVVSDDGLELQYLVAYKDNDGVSTERYFLEDKLVLVPVSEPTPTL